MAVHQFEAFCGPTHFDDVGDPCSCQCMWPIMYVMLYAVKVIATLRNRRKTLFLDPRFLEEDIPQISDMRFQIALTLQHVAGFG